MGKRLWAETSSRGSLITEPATRWGPVRMACPLRRVNAALPRPHLVRHRLRTRQVFNGRLVRDFGGCLVKNQKTTFPDPSMKAASTVSPKLRVVQSMLHDIVSDRAPDATMIFSHTLPAKAGDDRNRANADPRIAALPAMILQDQTLAALATCHEIEGDNHRPGTTAAQLSSVSDLRRCLEEELLETDIELVASDLRLRPVAKRNVLIGRPSRERAADVAINCRWFSRADKSLRLSSDGAEWFIEDLGSANGSFIGEKRLQRNSRHTLPPGLTTIEIGRSFDRRSPVILNLNRAAHDVVLVSVSVGAAFDKAGWQTWPTLQEDLAKRWLVFRDEFVFGSDYANKALGLETRGTSAALTFSNGFWIAPKSGSEISVNSVAFHSPVPLPWESDVGIGPLKLRAERPRDDVAEAASNAARGSRGGIQQ